MRKLFLLFALSCFAVSLSAQHLFVLEINGTAEIKQKEKWVALVKAQALRDDDLIRTSKYGSLMILDKERGKEYAVQSTDGAKVQDLLVTQKSSVKRFAKEVVEVISDILFNKKDKESAAFQTTGGVTYRSDNADEMIASWLKNNLNVRLEVGGSAYPISLHVIDPFTYQTIHEVKVGDHAELMVMNDSDIPLYMNVIDVDSEGQMSVVIPKNEAEMMTTMLIPPHASVILPYPISFFEPKGVDHLILLAYPMPFNLQRVIALYEAGNVDVSLSAEVGGSVRLISIK